MEVRLWEHHMARQHKTRRETDRKGDEPGRNFGCYRQAAVYMHRVTVKQVIVSQGVDNNVEHGIDAPARKVAEGLGRDNPGKWPMEEINKTNYDMSDPVVHR